MKAPTPHDDDHSASRLIPAGADAIYETLVDPSAVERWRAPAGMSCRVLRFDLRPGGTFQLELRYGADGDSGYAKTAENVDRLTGRFADIVPGARIVELVDFDTDQPAYMGRMTVTTTLTPAAAGTEVRMACENVPPGIEAADHRAGIASTLQNLERVVLERRRSGNPPSS